MLAAPSPVWMTLSSGPNVNKSLGYASFSSVPLDRVRPEKSVSKFIVIGSACSEAAAKSTRHTTTNRGDHILMLKPFSCLQRPVRERGLPLHFRCRGMHVTYPVVECSAVRAVLKLNVGVCGYVGGRWIAGGMHELPEAHNLVTRAL